MPVCQKFSDLRCKEVINGSNGCRLGCVSDMVIELDSGRVVSLIVPCCGHLLGLFPGKEEYVIPWNCIRRIGDDIILVELGSDGSPHKKEKKKYFGKIRNFS